MTDLTETDLSFSRVLPAPRSAVWACWTTPEHLVHWFVPAPHRVTKCDIDLRVGGHCNMTFDVEGNMMDNNGVYLELIEGEKLVFTDTYTAGWKPNPEPFMTAIITLEDTEDGQTLYTATVRHRSVEAAQQHKDMGFFDGWGIVADQLGAYAAKLAV